MSQQNLKGLVLQLSSYNEGTLGEVAGKLKRAGFIQPK